MKQRNLLIFTSVLFFIWFAFGKTYPVICTDASRLATIESLVHRGTFEISDSMFIPTCDKVRIPPQGNEGLYFADKPPLLSIMGAGIYYLFNQFGLDIRYDLATTYRLLTFFLVFLPCLLILYFLNLYLTAHRCSVDTKNWIMAAVVFGTLVFPYTMTLQNHLISAALLLGAYVFIENPMKWKKNILISGLLMGLTVAMDLNAAFFALPFSIFVIYKNLKTKPSDCILYFLVMVTPVFYTGYLFWAQSGKILPFVAQPETYFYQGSPLPRSNSFGGDANEPWPFSVYLMFLWQSTVGFKGVFSHSIALILGLVGLVLNIKKSNESKWLGYGILFGIISLWLFLDFGMPVSFGGSNFGFRYMILWMPLLLLFSYPLFENQKWLTAIKGLILISIVTSGMGVFSPWLIQKFNQLDLDTFDFMRTLDPASNPYLQADQSIRTQKAEIEKLRSKPTAENLMSLGFIYYQARRPIEALGYLQLVGEKNADWHCYAAVVFSKKGIDHEDLMKRHISQCPVGMWKQISESMKLTPKS